METVELGSSFEADDDDLYLNSVAKLKVLKTQASSHFNKEKDGKKKDEEGEPEILNDVVPKVTIAPKWPTRATRRQTRSRTRRQRNASPEQDSDVEIVSVKKQSKSLENDLMIIENNVESSEDENYDINIKILWRSKDIHRLSIRQNENFQKIFEYFANLEHVSIDEILITKKDKTIRKNDTPVSINLSVIDILEGGIIKKDDAALQKNSDEKVDEDVRIIKVQTTTKKSIIVPVKCDADFEKLLEKCAEELNVEKSKIKLYFDGELVTISDTPDMLEIEDEACFDLRISS